MAENSKNYIDFPVQLFGRRVYYVDPNDVYGFDKEKKVPFTPPYEDLCIAFNLIIEKFSRFNDYETEKIEISWFNTPTDDKTHFSVLEGDLKYGVNNYLTTYYTEISPEGYKKKEMIEGLGVESIQVNFDSYYTPTVVIKFVDVRGSALFGREEALHSDASGSGKLNADNIFGAFVTIPYPKFRLQIKGFYGRDVTYQLTCSNFKANFNAKTGNVEATATFIGYTWSILTDIPLAYLIAAPYCDYGGALYWSNHVDTEDWKMENTAESNAKQTQPPKLHQFFQNIRSCIKDAENGSPVSSGSDDSSDLTGNKREILTNIKENIIKFEKLTISKKKEDIDSKKVELEEVYINIQRDIERYPNKTDFNDITKDKNYFNDKEGEEYEIIDLKPLKDEINNLLKIFDDETKKLVEEDKKRFVTKSLEKIGIDPNIKNIFKILMCHLETFCHILFKAAEEIEAQERVGERTPAYLGIEIDNTDIPNSFGKDFPLPAWTAIFNHNGNNDSTDELKYSNMYQWVGNVSDKWIEERVVRSLQHAVQLTDPSSNNGVNNTSQKIDSILSLPSDINLSNSVFSKVFSLSFDNICGNLAFRAAQIFGVMDNTLENDISMVKTMGEIDAYNFYLSCDTVDDIQAYVLKYIDNGNATEIITGITTCNNAYDNYNGKQNNDGSSYHVFEIDKKRQPIFLKKNDTYEYVYFNDKYNKDIIPSKLVDFKNRGYNEFIEPVANGNVICYEGIEEDGKTKGWLNTDNSQIESGIKNYDMFGIIDDEGYINELLTKYNEIKTGNFKIKNYEVNNEEGFKNFVDRYWHLSYDDYKKMFPDKIGCTFIGKSYTSYFDNNEHKMPEKNYWTGDQSLWIRALDGKIGHTQYSLGDDYNKLKDDSEELEIDKLFIKSLYVLDTKGNSIGTLFGHPFYYTQNQITDNVRRRNAKAFLFLQSLNRSPNYYHNTFNTTHGSFTLYNKLNILYIGGLLWRQKYYDEHKVDGIKYDNPSNKPQYKECVKNGKITTIGGVSGLTIFGEKEDLNDKCITIEQYLIRNKLYLDNNIKQQLIDYFEKFAEIDFLNISSKCELMGMDKKTGAFGPITSGSHFQKLLEEQVNLLRTYVASRTQSIQLMGKCYAFTYCNMKVDEPTGVYMLFDEKESNEVQRVIKDVFFGKVIIMNNGSVNKPKNGSVVLKSNVYETYLTTFINTLRTISTYQKNNETSVNEDVSDNKEKNENILLSIYLYCKTVWEKWLRPMSGTSKSTNNEDDDINENHFDVSKFFKNFVFIDSYYNKIGHLLKINLDILLKSYEGRSKDGNLFSFISDIVAEHRCIFVGLPDYIDLGLGIDGKNMDAIEKMKDMFRPIPYSKMRKPRMDNHFVVIYTYPPASQLPDSLTYKFDGFDIYATNEKDNPFIETNKDKNASEEGITQYGYGVPSFAVAFGKQNNHLFKDFTISMDNPVETEQSIKSLWHAAELAKDNAGKICFHGQDVYNIFSNYSYQIEVEMMGNAQIQPLMYFQLLNIPMWRGAYMIFNVSHSMTAGNMTTRFKAMKMSKHPVPIVSSYWSWINNPNHNSDNVENGTSSNSNNSNGYYDAPEFKTSGQHQVTDKKASSNKLDAFTKFQQPDAYCSQVDKKYYNRGHNNYFMPLDLNTYTFKMKNGKEFNLEHAINFIYNMAHITTVNVTNKEGKIIYKKCTEKPPTKSSHMCARHVWCALCAGGLNVWGGDADNENSTRNAMQQGGFEQIYSTGQSLPKYAMPGDVVFKKYGNKGHAEFFTGMHWVSDFIQSNGLKSAPAGSTLEGALSKIYAIWRIPGIEKALKSTNNNGNSKINPASDNKSIFQTNSKYDFNAVCQPEGYFAYTFDNMKKCVLYFVAHGEGGCGRRTKEQSLAGQVRDYCGIARLSSKNELMHQDFFDTSTMELLDGDTEKGIPRCPQKGFVKDLDDKVFSFYYNNYYKPYENFLTNCKNPYCRYAGLLCLKGGSGFADSAWRSVLKKYGIESCSFSNINEDSKNALRTNNAFTQTLANTFFDKLFANYSSYNGGKENTTSKFKQYNKIYS